MLLSPGLAGSTSFVDWDYATGYSASSSLLFCMTIENVMKTIVILLIAYVGFVWLIARWLRLASRPDRQFRHEELAQEPTDPAVPATPQQPQAAEVTPHH
jgi:hypothetical protein